MKTNRLELKIIPPLVTLIAGLLMWIITKFFPTIIIIPQYKNFLAVIIAIFGLILMAFAALSLFRAKTTINPMKPQNSSNLVTSGIYKFSRNPIYLADLLFLLAFALFLNNLLSLIFILGFYLYMNKFQIIPEERFLEEKFGETYLKYKQKTRRWI